MYVSFCYVCVFNVMSINLNFDPGKLQTVWLFFTESHDRVQFLTDRLLSGAVLSDAENEYE